MNRGILRLGGVEVTMGIYSADGIKGATISPPGNQVFRVRNYQEVASRIPASDYGIENWELPGNHRITSVNINMPAKATIQNIPVYNFTGEISLRNVVTRAHIEAKTEISEPKKIEYAGGLYFNHGYEAYSATDLAPDPDISAAGLTKVNIDQIAYNLIHNQNLEKLVLSAHADRSGSADKNQTLSENRLNTAGQLLKEALVRQGLSIDEADRLYNRLVIINPNATLVAKGESDGPVKTADETREQANRVVNFQLVFKTEPARNVSYDVRKAHDYDNHDHDVVFNVGTGKHQSHVIFNPDNDSSVSAGQFAVADENINCIFRIDPNRALNSSHVFTLRYFANNNITADNTSFLIETGKPGAVQSSYDFNTRMINVTLDGKPVFRIEMLDNIVHPSYIRIGQVDREGNAVISPLTNLDAVMTDPGLEGILRKARAEHNILTQTADRIRDISVEAKNIYLSHPFKNYKTDTPEYQRELSAYLNQINSFGISAKVNQAVEDLEKIGINTEILKLLLVKKYTDPDSSAFSPDETFFPFQTYDGLYRGALASGSIVEKQDADPYKELLALYGNTLTSKGNLSPSAKEQADSRPDTPMAGNNNNIKLQ